MSSDRREAIGRVVQNVSTAVEHIPFEPESIGSGPQGICLQTRDPVQNVEVRFVLRLIGWSVCRGGISDADTKYCS